MKKFFTTLLLLSLTWLGVFLLLLSWEVAHSEEFNMDDGKTYDAVAVRFNAVTGDRMSTATVVKPGLTLSECNEFVVEAGATTPINDEYVLVGCMERTDEKTS